MACKWYRSDENMKPVCKRGRRLDRVVLSLVWLLLLMQTRQHLQDNELLI